jgi:hypothetical protein
VPASTTHAAILSVVPVLCFMIFPFR